MEEKIKVIGYSPLMLISIPDPRKVFKSNKGLIEIPQDSMVKVNVRLEFMNTHPDYSNKAKWWHVDEKSKTVLVQFAEDNRKDCANLMEKQQAGEKLNKEQQNYLETYMVMLDTMPRIAAQQASAKYPGIIIENAPEIDLDTNKGKTYRTQKRAGNIADVPAKMPIITNKVFQNAITYNNDDTAYLQPLSTADGLVFENGTLMFEGLPASAARLKHLYTKDNIENFDLPLLRVFYATILNKYAQTLREDNTIDEVITIYYPQLAKQLGKSANTSRADVEATINSILSFRNILGITEKGNNILPVLVYMGEDREKNTISFASPYMTKIIKDLYKASIRKNKAGNPLLKKDGTPKLLPAYTYLPNMTLAKERNKKAVEIVCIVVATIEQAGNNTPHISAKTIIERNQLLKQSLDNANSMSNQNTLLNRAFSKAWELLRTKTDILEKYKNIKLPDPAAKDFKATCIPTMGTLDMVFEFPHEGKVGKDERE